MNNSITAKSMAEVLAEDKRKNGYKGKIYKEMSDEHKSEQITQSVKNQSSNLRQAINAPKVDLSDTEEVQNRAFMYLEACSLSSTFPSVMGLSVVMGCSRQNLNRWLLSHPGHPTTNFVNMVKDLIADILVNASLYNSANTTQAIFQLKNHFDHADVVEIAPIVKNQTTDNDYNAEEIRERYISCRNKSIEESEEE